MFIVPRRKQRSRAASRKFAAPYPRRLVLFRAVLLILRDDVISRVVQRERVTRARSRRDH